MVFITGVTRIVMASIFSGFDNASVFDVTDRFYDKFFGFTREELARIPGCSSKLVDSLWGLYGGYRIGDVEVCDPGRVLKHIDAGPNHLPVRDDRYLEVRMRQLLDTVDSYFLDNHVLALVAGGSIRMYAGSRFEFELDAGYMRVLYRLMVACGYLRAVPAQNLEADLSFPNTEASGMMSRVIEERYGYRSGIGRFRDAVLNADEGEATEVLVERIRKSWGVKKASMGAILLLADDLSRTYDAEVIESRIILRPREAGRPNIVMGSSGGWWFQSIKELSKSVMDHMLRMDECKKLNGPIVFFAFAYSDTDFDICLKKLEGGKSRRTCRIPHRNGFSGQL